MRVSTLLGFLSYLFMLSFFFDGFGEFPIILQVINSIFGCFLFIIQPSYIFNLAIFQFPKSYYLSVPFSTQSFLILLVILDISNLSEMIKLVKCSFQFAWIIYFLKQKIFVCSSFSTEPYRLGLFLFLIHHSPVSLNVRWLLVHGYEREASLIVRDLFFILSLFF